jgi:predicted nucleic acid-binding protein
LKLVDASVAVKFALDEDDFPAARALMAEPIYAPELILGEAANGWWKAWRRGALSAEDCDAAIRSLASVFDQLVSSEPHIVRASELSRELEHPIYDCVYLALAEHRRDTLVTADEKLLRKLATTGYASLATSLADSC